MGMLVPCLSAQGSPASAQALVEGEYGKQQRGEWVGALPILGSDAILPRAQGALVPPAGSSSCLAQPSVLFLLPTCLFERICRRKAGRRGMWRRVSMCRDLTLCLPAWGSRGWVRVLVEDECALLKASRALLPVLWRDGVLSNVSSLPTLS